MEPASIIGFGLLVAFVLGALFWFAMSHPPKDDLRFMHLDRMYYKTLRAMQQASTRYEFDKFKRGSR